MYVCLCKGLTESRVRQVAGTGGTTAERLIEALGLADEACCGRCARNIAKLVAIVQEASPPAPTVPDGGHATRSSLSPS
jgi:bacterioferritin-associated ferredoxin